MYSLNKTNSPKKNKRSTAAAVGVQKTSINASITRENIHFASTHPETDFYGSKTLRIYLKLYTFWRSRVPECFPLKRSFFFISLTFGARVCFLFVLKFNKSALGGTISYTVSSLGGGYLSRCNFCLPIQVSAVHDNISIRVLFPVLGFNFPARCCLRGFFRWFTWIRFFLLANTSWVTGNCRFALPNFRTSSRRWKPQRYSCFHVFYMMNLDGVHTTLLFINQCVKRQILLLLSVNLLWKSHYRWNKTPVGYTHHW